MPEVVTPERVPEYQNVPQLTPEGVPKYQNCPLNAWKCAKNDKSVCAYSLNDKNVRISYGRVRGSGYNARTGNNVAICPGGEKKKKKKEEKKRPKLITKESVKKFRNLSQCQRNTQAICNYGKVPTF